jgi:hypothetical protein
VHDTGGAGEQTGIGLAENTELLKYERKEEYAAKTG